MKEILYKKLESKLKELRVEDGGVSIRDTDAQRLLEELLTAGFSDEGRQNQYRALLEQFREICACSRELFGRAVGDVGFEKYLNKDHECAQWIYRVALQFSISEDLQNNLAYICRRHGRKDNLAMVEIIDLLMGGVRAMSAFSLINMALLFALELGTEQDWKIADQLIGLIDGGKPDRFSAYSWWKDLAEHDDTEGCLICLWMHQHRIHTGETIEELTKMRRTVCRAYPTMPAWVLQY